jgi:hypothetical protein
MWGALGLIEWGARRHAGFLGDDKYDYDLAMKAEDELPVERELFFGEDIPSEEVRNDTAITPPSPPGRRRKLGPRAWRRSSLSTRTSSPRKRPCGWPWLLPSEDISKCQHLAVQLCESAIANGCVITPPGTRQR